MDNTLLIRTLADEQELLRAATQTLEAEAQALRDGDMVELERVTQTKQKQLTASAASGGHSTAAPIRTGWSNTCAPMKPLAACSTRTWPWPALCASAIWITAP